MSITRPIDPSDQRNFETLIAAINDDRVCLLSCLDTLTNELVVACAAEAIGDGRFLLTEESKWCTFLA